MKCILMFLIPAVLLAGMTGCTKEELPASAERITLVLDGSPRAAIVIPDSAGKTERFAAEELQKYVERISGARLDITKEGAREAVEGQDPEISRVFVGNTRSAAPLRARLSGRDTDSFLVLAVEDGANDLFLTGADERGTLWAVYDFLERELGCRWLAPGELWEIVPQRESIEIPVRARVEEPGLKYRIGSLGRGGTYSDLSLWTLKHRKNVTRNIHLPIEGMSARYHEQEPLPIEPRGWRSWHSVRVFRDSFGLEYPEWFAANAAGERPGRGQMCFVNPELRDYMAERFSRILREKPELDFVELGPCDGLARNFCHCEGCLDLDIPGHPPRGRRGGHTHRWLAVVNAVAGHMAETDPDRYLLATAYSSYQEPPDPDVIVPAENVMIKIATWDGCRIHGFEHEIEDETRMPDMHAHAVHRQWMDEWEDITPAGMLMSEYVGRHSMSGMAGTNPRRYIADIRYIWDRGWKGYWGIGSAADMGLRMVNDYAIARALWNPDIDPDELVRDFCDHAFGAASEHMQRFIHTIQDAYDAAGCCHVQGIKWMHPEPVAEARRHLDAALEAVSGDEAAERRLQAFDWHFSYMELAGPAVKLVFRVHKGETDPELMREAIRLGQEATAYRAEIREKHGIRFHAGWRVGPSVREGGSWHRMLEQLEREQ